MKVISGMMQKDYHTSMLVIWGVEEYCLNVLSVKMSPQMNVSFF